MKHLKGIQQNNTKRNRQLNTNGSFNSKNTFGFDAKVDLETLQ